MKNRLLCLFILILPFIGSCSYHFGQGSIAEKYRTVAIPYVEGDISGIFTQELIKEMSCKGALTYTDCNGDLILRVCLLKPEDRNIGFIYAPESDGNPSKIVVSNEARLTLSAQVTLIDRKNSCVIFGPSKIISFIDYDFEPDLSVSDVHIPSLAQLEMHPLAKETAFFPLFSLLSEKIVDCVNHSW